VSQQARRDEIVELAQKIAASREEGSESLRTLLPKCHRLCKLAEYEELALWTDLEMKGLTDENDRRKLESGNDVQRAARERFKRTRTTTCPTTGSKREHWLSTQGLELHAHTLRSKTDEKSSRGLVRVSMAIEQIKDEVHKVASDILLSYKFGDVVQGIFEQARSVVDARLVSLAPDAARELEAAYAQLGSAAEPEELAGAANACRRVLEDLADAIRPAGQGNDYGHDCGPDKYVNRLCAYACEQIESNTTTAVLVANIDYLAARIDTVNKLAHKGTHHKGTHHEFTLIEARMCLIHTYLVVADLLQLARVDDPAEDP